MRKNLLAIGLLAISFSASGQYLTYVGDQAQVYINDGALVYNGGGLKVVGDATATTPTKGTIKNHGDIMIVNDANDKSGSTVTFEANSDVTMVFGKKSASDTANPWDTAQKQYYGQLYIDIPQGKIGGKVRKEYLADVNHSTSTTQTGQQQTGLPFYKYTLGELDYDLGTYLNLNNGAWTTSGRWAYNTVHRWNNAAARFDHIVGKDTEIGKPTDYIIIPRRAANGDLKWNPQGSEAADIKTFKGMPVGNDIANAVVLQTTTVSSFGTKGSGVNWYRESYNSYLNDPFHDQNDAWNGTFGKNLSQFANPFLTNLDLTNLDKITGLDPTKVYGVAYYGNASVASWTAQAGGTYNNGSIVMATGVTNGVLQAGNTTDFMIKPLGEVMIKFNTAYNPTVNLNPARKFSQATISNPVNNPTGKIAAKSIPADKLVKQVAVIGLDANNNEVGRTYYAVSPSAVTGKSTLATMQGVFDGALYTKEEISTGGADATSISKLYINEANEVDYQGKEIPLVLNTTDIKSFKFLVYEGGVIVDRLTNGNSFYISKDNVITKVNTGEKISVSSANYNLYYGSPSGKGLIVANPGSTNAQTVIAKKDNDWVVRFSDKWKSASVEVYSAAGQLLHSAANVSTTTDYVLPLNNRTNGLYLIKTISETGDVVVKKIVK